MSGIFNLKFEDRTVEDNFDRLWLHLEKVGSLKNKLTNFNLSDEELNLVEYQLNNIPAEPSSYRFESKVSRQTNLKYRSEGVLGWIWEKIKAFFKWIKEQFMKLFGLSSKEPEKELAEVKESLGTNVKKYISSKPLSEKVSEEAERISKVDYKLPDGTIVTDFKGSPSAVKAALNVKKITLKTFKELAGPSINFNETTGINKLFENFVSIGNDYRTIISSFNNGIKSFKNPTVKKALEEFKDNLPGSSGLPNMFDFKDELTGDYNENNTAYFFCGASKIILVAFSPEKEKIFKKTINTVKESKGKDPDDDLYLVVFDLLVRTNILKELLRICESFKELSISFEKSFIGMVNKAEADFNNAQKEPTEESKKIYEALKTYLTTMLEFGVGFNTFYTDLVHFLSRVNESLSRVTPGAVKKDLDQILNDSDAVTITI